MGHDRQQAYIGERVEARKGGSGRRVGRGSPCDHPRLLLARRVECEAPLLGASATATATAAATAASAASSREEATASLQPSGGWR